MLVPDELANADDAATSGIYIGAGETAGIRDNKIESRYGV